MAIRKVLLFPTLPLTDVGFPFNFRCMLIVALGYLRRHFFKMADKAQLAP